MGAPRHMLLLLSCQRQHLLMLYLLQRGNALSLEMSVGLGGYHQPHRRVKSKVLLNAQQLTGAAAGPRHGLPVVPADRCCIFRIGEHHLQRGTAGGREQQSSTSAHSQAL